MVITTKMYKGYQTVIPAKIRAKLDINDTDSIDWTVDEENKTAILSFRKKPKLHNLSGIGKIEKQTNAVDLKHKSQKGLL